MGDVFTTAIGYNANSGKSPDHPMASIGALLAAYDLDALDVIHVDAGTYNLVKNITIDAQDSGVRIEGPGAIGSAGVAVLNRGNTVSGSYAIQFTGADDVTLDYLNITGGEYGIAAAAGADSDRITISHSEVHDNLQRGIFLESSNDNAVVADNHVHHHAFEGIYLSSGRGTTIRDNEVDHSTTGAGLRVFDNLTASTIVTTVNGNEVHDNNIGIQVNGTSPIDVQQNLVHHNGSGISAGTRAYVAHNEIYANRSTNSFVGYGINASNAVLEQNNVYDNDRGIDSSDSTIRDNHIFHNRDLGIQSIGRNQIVGNTIYSHNVGIRAYDGDVIRNNLIYDNFNDGIWVWSVTTGGARIENNTIYQPSTGDAIQVGGPHAELLVTTFNASNVTILNNILRVAQGYAINVAADSEIGLASDYNDFALAGTGKLARWEDRDFTSRQDWFFELRFDGHGIAADPQFIDVDGPDNKLGYDTATSTDAGLDDDFRVAIGSPTVDAGDPLQRLRGRAANERWPSQSWSHRQYGPSRNQREPIGAGPHAQWTGKT